MFRNLFALWGVAASCLLVLQEPGSAQQTWQVPTQFPTIQAAVDGASIGDTIEVLPGVYPEVLDIRKALTLRSTAGPLATIIDANLRGSVVSIRNAPGAGVTLEGFTLRNGRATTPPWGGGVLCVLSNAVLRGNYVHGNFANSSGGGLYLDRSNVDSEGNVIWDNFAVLFGGGVAIHHSNGSFTHNTVSGNVAASAGGGGVDVEDSGATGTSLSNSVLWGNQGGATPDLQLFKVHGSSVSFCDVGQGAPVGPGNVAVNPAFIAAAQDNYRLLSTSPVIDAGDPLSSPDPDGTVPDMGALPFSQAVCSDPVNYCAPVANSSGEPARMCWDGTASVAANDLVLGARHLPSGQNGLFIYSPDEGSLALGDGLLCLGSQTLGFILRLQPTSSDGEGLMRHLLDLTSPPHPLGTVQPGSTWNFQCWFRDVPAAMAGFNFSDGLRITFCP